MSQKTRKNTNFPTILLISLLITLTFINFSVNQAQVTTYVNPFFTWTPVNPSTNENITFTANTDYNNTNINWYYWDFNDTSTFNSTNNIAFHQFLNNEAYNVTLIENSILGNSTVLQTVVVGNEISGQVTGFWSFIFIGIIIFFIVGLAYSLTRRRHR